MTATCRECGDTFQVCGRGRVRCAACHLRIRRELWRASQARARARYCAALEQRIDAHLAHIRATRRFDVTDFIWARHYDALAAEAPEAPDAHGRWRRSPKTARQHREGAA